MKKLSIILNSRKMAAWYQNSTGIRANLGAKSTVETIIRDFIVEQSGPDYGNHVQGIDMNLDIYWELTISGDGPEFMKICRAISEAFSETFGT